MTRKHIIISVGIILAASWLGLFYLVLRAPQYTEKTVTVSPSPHYATPSKSSFPQIVQVKNGMIRTTSHSYMRPTQVQPMTSTPTPISTSPFTYLSSNATMKSVGSGTILGTGQEAQNTSSGQRGIVYAGSSHSWIGFVSPVASRDMAYVESSAGSLPDKSYLSGVRKAPPEEGGGGTNGPDIENEQPIGDGILFLLIAVVIYTIAIFFEHKKRKNKKL